MREERHARAELEVVGRMEDVLRGFAWHHAKDELSAQLQARAEHGMPPVLARLLEVADAVEVRSAAAAQLLQLREDVPHPVRRLVAGTQLGADPFEHGILRLDESLQVEGVV